MFELSPHGTDVHVGDGPRYQWGGLHGGQIVAQALRASAISVDPELEPHSIRTYFIRRGDHTEPVRYEVDRIRNGRSFATRRVVVRQAIGALLNAESSFQRPERAAAFPSVTMPEVPDAESSTQDSWTPTFDRVMVPTDRVTADRVTADRVTADRVTADRVTADRVTADRVTADRVTGGARDGTGRAVAWMRVTDDLGDPGARSRNSERASRSAQHRLRISGFSYRRRR